MAGRGKAKKVQEFQWRLYFGNQRCADTKTYVGPGTPKGRIGDALRDLMERTKLVKGANVDTEAIQTAMELLNNKPDPTLAEPMHLRFFLEDAGIWFDAKIMKERVGTECPDPNRWSRDG